MKACFSLALLLAATSLACGGSARMTRSHGRAYHEAVARQTANPAGAPQKPARGLDSQEAAIVANSYRKGLTPKGTSAEEQPLLLLAQPPGPNASR
jgi:hypothetical protein